MGNSLDNTFNTLEKITDLRYRSEQNLIDILHSQLKRSSNKSMAPLVNGGMNLLNSALENRHELEQSILRKIRIEAEKNVQDPDTPGEKDAPTVKPTVINSGTFMVKTFLRQKKVQIPLNINNYYDDNERIIVTIEELKNMNTGDLVKNKITADKSQLNLPPQSTTQLKVEIDIKNGFRTQNQYFSTLTLKGKEHRVFQVILDILSAKNKKEKASLTFLPATK